MKRFEFDGRYAERGGQQFVSGRGSKSDGWTEIHRIETHGFASVPVKGAQGLLLPMPSNPDVAFVLGGEHPDLRPKDLPQGGKALYDAGGNVIKMLLGDGVTFDLAGAAYTVRKGGVTFMISGDGVDIVGGYLKVNGVRVDETHRHDNVETGTGTSGTVVP
ncbi:phage baseplate assembly protein domain-containing protein [Shinella zoogloeoides]|uniref:phage baseplate assembly protein domain-containing protein n=1 Tax=Shinella zoogloeoides TaxID=352475 RepID=UPI001F5A8597|nr:phage baseplate assembly protein [Shinella zoogloeoides]